MGVTAVMSLHSGGKVCHYRQNKRPQTLGELGPANITGRQLRTLRRGHRSFVGSDQFLPAAGYAPRPVLTRLACPQKHDVFLEDYQTLLSSCVRTSDLLGINDPHSLLPHSQLITHLKLEVPGGLPDITLFSPASLTADLTPQTGGSWRTTRHYSLRVCGHLSYLVSMTLTVSCCMHNVAMAQNILYFKRCLKVALNVYGPFRRSLVSLLIRLRLSRSLLHRIGEHPCLGPAVHYDLQDVEPWQNQQSQLCEVGPATHPTVSCVKPCSIILYTFTAATVGSTDPQNGGSFESLVPSFTKTEEIDSDDAHTLRQGRCRVGRPKPQPRMMQPAVIISEGQGRPGVTVLGPAAPRALTMALPSWITLPPPPFSTAPS
ncbi:hypothetical protein J6590_054545 [Homalodisca vitripennis]|nr:hypothetical protein J6590_054545 [Homalodisca vitripennis]